MSDINLKLFKLLLIALLTHYTIAVSNEEDPFNDYAKIKLENGNVILEAANNKNITFKSSNGGSILVNDNDLELLIESGVVAAHTDHFTTTRLSNIDHKISIFEEQINTISENGLNTLENRVTELTSKLDDFIGIGHMRLTNIVLRRALVTIRNLETEFNFLKQKLLENKCLSNPCRNGGTCLSIFNGFKCVCENGWQGLTCDEDVNECLLYHGTDIGCQNGAECINTPGSYRCECKADWRGIHCTEKYDDCNSASNKELCDHGTCVNVARRVTGQPNYHCLCDQGWTTDGVNPACSVDVDECSDKRPHCSVNPPVDCYNLPGNFECGDCPPGFTGNGIVCVDINECEIENGGCSQSPIVQCSNTYGSRICGACPSGFTGDGVECTFVGLCQVNNGGCNPEATCVDDNGEVRCQCPPQKTGNGVGPNGCVPEPYTGCESNPCIHGICYPNASSSSFHCKCFESWTGVLCNVSVDECDYNLCQNGGTCVKQGDEFECICDVHWQGKTCEEVREECGALFQQQFGFIKYPLTNNNENEDETDCVWVIKTAVGRVINLIFESFHIENSPNCSMAFLQLNDGDNREASQIGRFCGDISQLPNTGNIKTSNNHIYIWYRKTNFRINDGFELKWNTTNADCGGDVLDTQFGTIQFPKNGGLYKTKSDCFWLVKVNPSQKIQLHFSLITIESHENCDYDYLKVYDGQLSSDRLLATFCNSSQPSPLISSTSDILIHFHSDAISNNQGFHLTYSAIPGIEDCGGTLTSASGSLRSPHPSNFEGEIRCNWLISVNSNDKILLEFSEFDLRQHETCESESLEIFDGNDEEAPLIGRYCGNRLQKIISSRNTLYIKYRSDHIISEMGFTASYTTFCGGYFNSKTGIIRSPNYPNDYPSNQKCIYHIEVETENIIQLKFDDLDIEDLWDGCKHDFVELREGHQENGTLLEKLCGNHSPPLITSTVNEVWLTFVTDSSLNYRGFSVNYTTINVGCGGVLKSNSGTISSPSLFLMPLNAECKWMIVAPPQSVIVIEFPLFSLSDNGGNCDYDFVEIREFDNSVIGKYCGRLNIHTIQSRSNVLIITYERNVFAPTEGFEINYEFRDVSNLCGGVLTSENGYIRSPNFPNNYPKGSICTWVVKVEAGHQISLEAKTFDLSDHSCQTEFLIIRNGQFADSSPIGKFCGSKMKPFILSHSNIVSLYFHSNSTTTGKGFELYFESAIRGCGGTVSQQSGTIMSPNYPLSYNHNSVCDWIIHVSRGSTVEVTLADVDFEVVNGNCSDDYLELFDGNSDTARLIAKICVFSYSSFVSTKNSMFVKFRTDSRISHRGFKLHYNSNCVNRVNDYRGVIESPNYPNLSTRELNCLWTVEVPRGNNITFAFSHRNIAIDEHCFVINTTAIREDEAGLDYIFDICANNHSTIPLSFSASSNVAEIKFSKQTKLSLFRLEWYAVGCGGEFVDKKYGWFTSPNYPSGYPRNTECLWHIRVPLQHFVVLHFDKFDLETQPDVNRCNADYLEVYGGPDLQSPLLTTLCHKLSNSTTVSSSGNEMTVRFKSDNSMSGIGFSARFEAKPGSCGGIFEHSNGTITSKNYPGKYDAKDDCRWLIKAQGFHRVKLSFDEFDIPQSSNCSSSYVIVYDGEHEDDIPLLRHCGSVKPETIRSTGDKILVRLKGDGVSAGKGFKLQYETICGGTFTIANNDHTSYELKSSNYPYKPANMQICNWVLKTVDPSEKIMLSFTRLITNESFLCTTNYIEVREGDSSDDPLIGRYCESKTPAPITSEGNSLYIYMHENAVFRAVFTTSISTCGGVLDAKSGYFISPGYPNNYPLSSECIWTITSSPGNLLTLSFENFRIESSEFCNSDYVEVRRNDSDGTLLGRFCGDTTPVSIPSSNIFWIKFRSDDIDTDEGFSAFYSLLHEVDITGTSGLLTSPQYPEIVSTTDGIFTWRITATENTFIMATFLDIEIVAPQSGGSCYNYVEVFNGVNDNKISIAKYCGFVVPEPLVSTSNVITVIYSSSYPGKFKIKWEVTEDRTIEKPPLSTVTTDSENICGETVFIDKSSNFELMSPDYPNYYSNNLNCSWILNAPLGHHLNFDILDLDTEGDSFCFYDKLQFYEPLDYNSLTWRLNKTVCGRSKPKLHSTSNRIRVDFITDSSVSEKGFKINVITRCGGSIYETEGTISSQDVSNSNDCEWTVSVRQGRSIVVKFIELNIESKPMCHSAFVLLRNGPTHESPFLGNGTYCGNAIPDALQTSSNHLFVKFSASANIKANFRLEFNELSENCGGYYELHGSKKSIALFSPNYPHPPPHDCECDWVVISPPNTNIRIDFEVSPPLIVCNRTNEYIEIRDGGTINSRLIEKICVPPRLSSYTSTENIIFIRFETSGNSLFTAFKATANINICGGGHHVSDSPIKIQSPNYPNGYSGNLDCLWRIETAFLDDILSVTFEEIDFMSSSNDCNSGDVLIIRDGDERADVIGSYCSSTNNNSVIKSSGAMLSIEFKSNQINSGKGFSLSIKAERNDCGGIVDPAVSGQISTPGFPNASPYPKVCRWIFRTAFDRRIKIEFENYDLKQNERIGTECIDELRVHKSPVATYEFELGDLMPCNNLIPAPIESRTMGITLTFKTNGLNVNEGFKATYTTDDEIQCGGKLLTGNVDIVSYGFPGTSFGNETLYCLWLFDDESNNELKTKAVIFEVFEIFGETMNENGDKLCMNDVVVFGTGEGFPLVSDHDNFCGNKTATDFYYIFDSSESKSYMYLAMKYINNYRGIKAKYVIEECGGFFESDDYWNVTSPGFPDGYTPNCLCQWTFDALYGRKLQITFNRFELESDCEKDYLMIKNGMYSDSPIIGVYCGSNSPNIVTSSNGALSLIFRTDSLGTAPGFNFNVEVISKACGGFYSDFSKIIQSPNYPKQYENDVECQWHIDVKPSYHFEIEFIGRFDIEMSNNCENDFILIEEYILDLWIKVGQFCGQTAPSKLKTVANNIRITFRTNEKIAGDGFKLKSEVKCGAKFTGTTGVITSPGYPDLYASKLMCEFRIERSDNEIITLEFEDFNVEMNSKCNADSVTIYTGNDTSASKYGPYCGKGIYNKPPVITSYKFLLIVFKSDYSAQYTGFKATYRSVSCGGNMTAAEGEIQSPNIVNQYMNNKHCVWNINVNEERVIEIKFTLFSLEYCFDCYCDSVTIYDGNNQSANLIGVYCEKSLPPIIKSSSNQLTVVFKSDHYYEEEGFRLVYRSTLGEKQGCGGLLQNISGVILSPDIDNDGFYENDLDCTWTILVSDYDVIQLSFETLNIEAGESNVTNCPHDYLKIYDGASQTDSLIDTYCGNELPAQISSSKNTLLIHFHSDDHWTTAGFKVRYNATKSSCGSLYYVTNATFTITSPGYPSSFQPLLHCRYHFSLQTPALERVSFKFSVFNLSCEDGDYVEFVDDEDLQEPYRICGEKNSLKLVGIHGIWMTFNSGAVVGENRKFSLDINLMNCNETFDSDSGFITNSHYPATSLSMNCIIHINTAVNTKISIYFYDFMIDSNQNSSNCNIHNMEVVTDSNLVATLCSGAVPNPIFVPSNQLTLRINPNFYLKYYILYSSSYLEDGCGGNLTSINGVFTSPKYPEAYKKNATCIWYIRSIGMHSLIFTFTEFDMNSNNGCESNFVELYDGLGINEEKLVNRYCGNDTPAVHYLEGNTITVRMVTDIENDGIGFRAKFSRSLSGFASKSEMTSFTKPEVRNGTVYLSGL